MPEEKTDAEVREDKTRAALSDLAGKPGSPRNDKMIAALLRERAGLEQQGKADRVAEVDAQLEHYGYNKPDGAKTDGGDGKDDSKTAARRQPPQGRSSKPQQTGD